MLGATDGLFDERIPLLENGQDLRRGDRLRRALSGSPAASVGHFCGCLRRGLTTGDRDHHLEPLALRAAPDGDRDHSCSGAVLCGWMLGTIGRACIAGASTACWHPTLLLGPAVPRRAG